MKYTVQVNQELYFDLYLSNGKFHVDDHQQGIARFVKLRVADEKIVISVLHKDIAFIDIHSKKLKYTGEILTSTEIRACSEIIRNGTEQSKELMSEVSKISVQETPQKGMVKTELHTHFLEMLTGKDFLEVLFMFVDRIPVDSTGHLINYTLNESGQVVPLEDCIAELVPKRDCDKFIGELSLPVSGQKGFDYLTNVLNKRCNLIEYAAKELLKRLGEDVPLADAKRIIYYQLLVKSLLHLKKFGIKYVELSYSNDKTIKRILEYGKEQGFPEGIEFRFLLSANRQRFNNPRYVSYTKKSLKALMEQGLIAGFDLMGEELPLSQNDKNINDPCSFANFVDYALPLLNEYNGSVLRLHMGENRHSMVNPVTSLEIIDEIATRRGLVIPPPTIRIGHGVFFERIDEKQYVSLLKKYGVIVEINASSNFALGNVRELIEIPYQWYKERNIPFVLATDGGGAYLTDSIQEGKIALSSSEDLLEHIRETEKRMGR